MFLQRSYKFFAHISTWQLERSLQSAQFEGGPPKISVTEFSNQPHFEYMVTGSPSVMGLTNGHECIFAECNDITVKLTFGPV